VVVPLRRRAGDTVEEGSRRRLWLSGTPAKEQHQARGPRPSRPCLRWTLRHCCTTSAAMMCGTARDLEPSEVAALGFGWGGAVEDEKAAAVTGLRAALIAELK
jgi:hypothetical protein